MPNDTREHPATITTRPSLNLVASSGHRGQTQGGPSTPEPNPDRRSRRLWCGSCGWQWIGSLARCPRCEDDVLLSRPVRRVGWHPGQLDGSLELYGSGGDFLGGIEHRDGVWVAFTDRSLGAHAWIEEAMRAVCDDRGFVPPPRRRGAWIQIDDEAQREVYELQDDAGAPLARIAQRGRMWFGYTVEVTLTQRKRRDEAQRFVEMALNVEVLNRC